MKKKFIKTAAAGLLAISALGACEHTESTSKHSCGKSGCGKNDCGKNSCKKAGQKVEKSWWQR